MAGIEEQPEVHPGFHPAQNEVARSKARFRVLVAGRRWGKTRLGVWEALRVAREGGRAWWVAPTYPLANEGWRPLRSIGRQMNCQVREADREVNIPQGGQVQVRSADEPHRLRGAGLDLVVVDEAAFCKEETWTEALRPALTDRLGRALFISTPKGRNWFADLYDQAATRDDWQRFQYPTLSNPHIPPGEVQAAALEMPSLVWRQEYLAEFVESQGARYSADWFRYYTPTVKDGIMRFATADGIIDSRDCQRFCTVDLAASLKTSADFTVVCSVACTPDTMIVLDLVRKRMEGPDIVPAVEDQMRRWDLQVAHIESSGFQLALVQEARRQGLPVKELKADRDKVARSLALEARMEHGQVWFPRDAAWLPDLERELLAFPVGEHDDQVDALAYAAAAMFQPKKHDWSKAGPDDLEGRSGWRL